MKDLGSNPDETVFLFLTECNILVEKLKLLVTLFLTICLCPIFVTKSCKFYIKSLLQPSTAKMTPILQLKTQHNFQLQLQFLHPKHL